MSTYNDFQALNKDQQAQVLLAVADEEISERELEQNYKDWLNVQHEEGINVCGYTYEAADVLHSVDPTAYQCGLADWLGAEADETIVELAGHYYPCDAVDAAIAALNQED